MVWLILNPAAPSGTTNCYDLSLEQQTRAMGDVYISQNQLSRKQSTKHYNVIPHSPRNKLHLDLKYVKIKNQKIK